MDHNQGLSQKIESQDDLNLKDASLDFEVNTKPNPDDFDRNGLPAEINDNTHIDRKKQTIGANRSKNTFKTMAKPKNFNIGLALDTDAINELYTYGGEQGKKRTAEESEMEDFESGILELANQCLAAMSRAKPTDPIIYENEENGGKNVKRSFQQKFGA